jgi:hypothetical protein
MAGSRHEGADVSGYLAQLEAFRQSDRARSEMVEELVDKYEDLMLRYEQKNDDYNNEVESRRHWQTKASKSERDLFDIKREAVSILPLPASHLHEQAVRARMAAALTPKPRNQTLLWWQL